MSKAWARQMRGTLTGIPPEPDRLGIPFTGTLRAPEPQEIVARLQASRVGRRPRSGGGGTWTSKDPTSGSIADGIKTLWIWRY
jgi:hypothetical protein